MRCQILFQLRHFLCGKYFLVCFCIFYPTCFTCFIVLLWFFTSFFSSFCQIYFIFCFVTVKLTWFVFQHIFEHLTTLKTIIWFGLFLINSIEEFFGLLSFSKYFVKNVIGKAKHYLQVVSVRLFWFYSVSFSYNGEYFLRIIF